MWITNYLGVAGDSIEVAWNEAGELVDSVGNWFTSDSAGNVYNAFGEWVGTLFTTGGAFIEDTRDQIIDAAGDAAVASVITVGVVIVALYVVAKVL